MNNRPKVPNYDQLKNSAQNIRKTHWQLSGNLETMAEDKVEATKDLYVQLLQGLYEKYSYELARVVEAVEDNSREFGWDSDAYYRNHPITINDLLDGSTVEVCLTGVWQNLDLVE